jgi:hypothetical protein
MSAQDTTRGSRGGVYGRGDGNNILKVLAVGECAVATESRRRKRKGNGNVLRNSISTQLAYQMCDVYIQMCYSTEGNEKSPVSGLARIRSTSYPKGGLATWPSQPEGDPY